MFLFSHVQAELYQDYKDLMYGPNAAPLAAENCDSDAEVLRPGSKVNTPAAYDSSSEDEALNQKIASRRNQLGIFERSRAVKAVFLETDSDSDVDKQPPKRQKSSASRNPGKVPSAPRSTRSKNFVPRVRSPSPSSHSCNQVTKPKSKGTHL